MEKGGRDLVFLPWRDGEEGDDVDEVGHDVYASRKRIVFEARSGNLNQLKLSTISISGGELVLYRPAQHWAPCRLLPSAVPTPAAE
jgi:hypothetical protein